MERPLRVALPMLTLVQGGMGGSETYARELTRHLAQNPGLDVVALVPAKAAGFSLGVPEYAAANVRGGASTIARLRSQVRASLSRELRGTLVESDVVHYPLSVPVPRPSAQRPWVQTIHDLQHHDLPDLFSRRELEYRRITYDRPAKRADVVLTISEFSRQRIVQHLEIAPEKVRVAHLGVDTDAFVSHVGPRDRFVLYPARGWPHKNHAILLDAMHIARRKEPDLRLVLTGGDLDRLGELPRWVDNRGFVSRGELVKLYQEAACLVFPSKYEGFGLPPLEAMASGCPVAAADAGSLPEICGDAAILFDPENPEEIANAVIEAATQGTRLVEAGLERCARFTWQACADAHESIYRAAARRQVG